MPFLHRCAVLLICVIWSGNFIASAIAVDHLPPITTTALRFGFVLALLWPWLKPPARDQWLNLLMACWCMGALHFSLVFTALSRSADVSSLAILLQVYVPMSTLLAVLVLGERIGWRTWSGIGLAFSGVLIVGLDPLVLSQLDVVGLALASAFFLALGTVFMRRVQGVGLFDFQAWNALFSLIPLAGLALWLESPFEAIAGTPLNSPAWWAVVYSAIGSSIVGHGIFYWLVQRHEINAVTPYLLLVPVLAVALAVTTRGDQPGPRLLAGGAMVVLGVLWVTVRARYRKPPDAGKPAASAPAAARRND
jgi:O-acetylserine/cysteine efflux transporter